MSRFDLNGQPFLGKRHHGGELEGEVEYAGSEREAASPPSAMTFAVLSSRRAQAA